MDADHVHVAPDDEGLTSGAIETPATDEPVAEASAEIVDAAVAVAEIQADRDVQIAEIQAETTEAVIEAQAEIATAEAENQETWRNSYETLAAELQDARQMMAAVQVQYDQMMETLTAQAAAIAALTPSTPPPPSEQEAMPERSEAQDGRAEAEPETGLRKRRWM